MLKVKRSRRVQTLAVIMLLACGVACQPGRSGESAGPIQPPTASTYPTPLAPSRTSPSSIVTSSPQPAQPGAGPRIANVSDNRAEHPGDEIPQYAKLEITFDVENTTAGNFQLPYDPDPPPGIDPAGYAKHSGISVDAQFTPDGWRTVYRQPAFYYQVFEDDVKRGPDGAEREWTYPTDKQAWKVRFSPDQPGTWEYRLVAQDAGGSVESGVYPFTVVPSRAKGFIRISQADPRYFEFDDGSLFYSHGANVAVQRENPIRGNEPGFAQLRENSVQFVRSWISDIYGSAWLDWIGGRNMYDGYLPRSGLLPFHDPLRDRDVLTLRVDYEPDGDTKWFDACRLQPASDLEAVKRNTEYRLEITYWGEQIDGPRDPRQADYGLVGKIGGPGAPDCYESGTSAAVTGYGGNTTDWGTITGTWFSGDNDFLPPVHIALENVTQGRSYITSISLRENIGHGRYGPEILGEPSMEYELAIPEQSAYALDKAVALAESYGLYLKLVIMDKGDEIYRKLDDDGTWVIGDDTDNGDGFYGLGREVNKTRWLQQAWWRYLQARWGYSPNIHSWELTNEGDPFSIRHHQLADEFGKFMRCRVFGVPVSIQEGARCTYEHPNRHLVTTSMWHSFPSYRPKTGEGFWGSPDYPNVDYADVHAYISTSYAPPEEKLLMEGDAAYYHLWHSQNLQGRRLAMPIVRGEAGMDRHDQQCPDCLGIQRDLDGVWAHNYIWSTVDDGGLYELYWWWDGPQGHIYSPGVYDHRPVYRAFAAFMQDIPLNDGSYEDLAATASDDRLRAWGQKDLVNGRAHLWIQNQEHTWRNAVDDATVTPASGTITIPGFQPGVGYTIEWWDPYAGQPVSNETSQAKADGSLELGITNLATDVAAKITSN